MTLAIRPAAPSWLQQIFGGVSSQNDKTADQSSKSKKARRKSSAATSKLQQQRRRASSASSTGSSDCIALPRNSASAAEGGFLNRARSGRTYAIPSSRLLMNIFSELAILVLTFTSMFISNLAISAWYPFDVLKATAIRNALNIIAVERALGFYWEKRMQDWALDKFGGVDLWWWWNTYYAGVHTVVTVGTMVYLLVRMLWWDAGRARRWDSAATPKERWAHKLRREPHHQYFYLRTIFVISTALSTWGYIALPTMPPRLLNYCGSTTGPEPDLQGACDSNFYYVDTIREYGSLFWTWKDVKKSANPYAAFPSVHTLWSAFVAFCWIWIYGKYVHRADSAERASLWKVALHQMMRFSIVLYPLVTVYCIIVTANHYIIDALGGLIILAFSIFVTNMCFRGRKSHKQIRTASGRKSKNIGGARGSAALPLASVVIGTAHAGGLSASNSESTLANDSREELCELVSSSSDGEMESRIALSQNQAQQRQHFLV